MAAAGCAECPTGKDTGRLHSGAVWFVALATWAEAASCWAHHFFAQTTPAHVAPRGTYTVTAGAGGMAFAGPSGGAGGFYDSSRCAARQDPAALRRPWAAPGASRRRAAAVPPNPLPVASGGGLDSPAEGEVASGASD